MPIGSDVVCEGYIFENTHNRLDLYSSFYCDFYISFDTYLYGPDSLT